MGVRSRISSSINNVVGFYLKNYRRMVLIPIVLVFIFGGIIVFHQITYGTPVNEDISLAGGVSITVNTNVSVSGTSLLSELSSTLGQNQITVAVLHAQFSNAITGYTITAGKGTNVTLLESAVSSALGITLNANNSTVTFVSPTLAQSAIYDALVLLTVAFILVALVSLFYFRNGAQAFSNVISIVSDVINVIGVMDLLGITFSTASIAGILMLVGYSADRNIILATNILKRKEGSIKYRLIHTIRTSGTMDTAAFVVFLVLLVGASNSIIQNIATILLIGLIFDDFTVWILNGSIQLASMKYKEGAESTQYG